MNIIVTGASRGIGWSTVRALASRGGHRMVALSRNEAKLLELQQSVQKDFGQPIDIVVLDLVEVQNASLPAAIQELGPIDLLINNAGVLINRPFLSLSREDWQRTFEVNLFGAVELIKALHPQLKAAVGAHIINIGSMGGFQGSSKFPGLSAYSAAKAGLANLTECIAAEFSEDQIRCNCLCLGAVQTEMLAAAFPGFKAPVTADEMGEFVAHFALEGSTFFNGQVLPVTLGNPG